METLQLVNGDTAFDVNFRTPSGKLQVEIESLDARRQSFEEWKTTFAFVKNGGSLSEFGITEDKTLAPIIASLKGGDISPEEAAKLISRPLSLKDLIAYFRVIIDRKPLKTEQMELIDSEPEKPAKGQSRQIVSDFWLEQNPVALRAAVNSFRGDFGLGTL